MTGACLLPYLYTTWLYYNNTSSTALKPPRAKPAFQRQRSIVSVVCNSSIFPKSKICTRSSCQGRCDNCCTVPYLPAFERFCLILSSSANDERARKLRYRPTKKERIATRLARPSRPRHLPRLSVCYSVHVDPALLPGCSCLAIINIASE